MATSTVEGLAQEYDLTNRRVLDLARALGAKVSRPSDQLDAAVVQKVLDAIMEEMSPAVGTEEVAPNEAPRFVGVSIRSYRSISDISLDSLPSPLVVVGPNNSGKTNLLKAFELVLTASSSQGSYLRTRDLTFGLNERQRTGLTASFQLPQRSALAGAYIALLSRAGFDARSLKNQQTPLDVVLRVDYNPRGTTSVRLRPLKLAPSPRDRDSFEEAETELIEDLLNHFAVHYIPSVKNVRELYRDLVLPSFVRTAARSIQPSVVRLKRDLRSISDSLSEALHDIGLTGVSTELTLPNDSVEDLLRAGFDLRVSDPEPTSIFEKGHGIQTTILLASLVWMTEDDEKRGKQSVWLIEEPESYLHPELAQACRLLINRLSQRSSVVVTTHSLSFLPSDPRSVRGMRLVDDRSTIEEFSSYQAATSRIRRSLGVRFRDFLQMGDINVLVEGKSDVSWLRWFVSLHQGRWPHLETASFIPLGGAQHIRSFLEWNFQYLRHECALAALLDGDDEGLKVYQKLDALASFKGADKNDYAVVGRNGFAVEGLLPDAWTESFHEQYPDLFEKCNLDAQGELIELKVSDKDAYFDLAVDRAESAPSDQWDVRLVGVCDALEQRLSLQTARLNVARNGTVALPSLAIPVFE